MAAVGASRALRLGFGFLLIAARGGEAGEVSVLAEGTFDAALGRSPLFVKFYAPWCGHSKRMAPVWKELAGEDVGDVVIADVDCSSDTALCSEKGITGYPTLYFFPSRSADAVEYTGGRSLQGLTQFVSSMRAKMGKTDAAVHTINAGLATLNGANFDAAIQGKFAFVKFFAPWCGHCKRMAPVWRELAAKYEDDESIMIGEVDCTQSSAFCTRQEVRGYPTLLIFREGTKQAKYSGPRQLTDFVSYIEAQRASTVEAAADSTTENVADKPEVIDGVTVVRETNMNSIVQKDWTFIKFYAPWCGHCKAMAPAWVDLAAEWEDDDRITIAEVDCEAEPTLCSSWAIKGYPSLFLFKNAGHVDTYTGPRDIAALSAYLRTQVSAHDEL